MRAVCEALGIHDVVGKSLGSTNPHNMVKATFNALTLVVSPRTVAAKRGRKVADILGRRDPGGDAAAEAARAVGAMAVVMLKVTQVKSAIARPAIQERTLIALGAQQAPPQPRAGRHPGQPRADREGQAPAPRRAGRGRRAGR